MGIYAFNTQVLHEVLMMDRAHAGSCHDFGRDIIPRMLDAYRVFAFPYRGYWVDVGTIEAYWQAHMELLSSAPRLNLLDRTWVIHTRSEERPPVDIRDKASISRSLITDGCVIEGTVDHSVLSPGVAVQHGAVVRDSILMTDSTIEEGAVVDHAIMDKRVRIGAGARIGPAVQDGIVAHGGLTVIGKNTPIPAHTEIGPDCIIGADLSEDDFGQGRIPGGTSIGTADVALAPPRTPPSPAQ